MVNSQNSETIIKNGRIVTATDVYTADIGIRDGKIIEIGDLKGAEKIDATGMLVFPGGVDVHTHLDMPFMGTASSDDFETGTIAAAFGGTTSIVDFVIPKIGESLGHALRIWDEKAKKACIDYGFHMAMTDINDSTIEEMGDMVKRGIPSFKLFLAYKGTFMSDDYQILLALERARELHALIMVHAENGDMIDFLTRRLLAQGKTEARYHPYAHPAIAEEEATKRAIALAELAKTSIYVVHLTFAGALNIIKETRARGLPVYSETCPQYLLLDDNRYNNPDAAKYVMSPPLRGNKNLDALWAGLSTGDIQTVATDHCPFFLSQKDNKDFDKIPNGIPGIETRIPLMYSAMKGSLMRFVEVCSTAPAKLMGMYPRKGTIAPGSDADLVIFDPEKEVILSHKNLHQRTDYTPFEGFKVTGYPVKVIVNGELLIDEGEFVGKRGKGNFLRRD